MSARSLSQAKAAAETAPAEGFARMQMIASGKLQLTPANMRHAREYLGMSQKDFADALGFKRDRTVRELEAGVKDGVPLSVSDTVARLIRCYVAMALTIREFAPGANAIDQLHKAFPAWWLP